MQLESSSVCHPLFKLYGGERTDENCFNSESSGSIVFMYCSLLLPVGASVPGLCHLETSCSYLLHIAMIDH